MTFSIRRAAVTTLAASLLSAGAAFTELPGTAYAGTNGQQIEACDYQILYGAVRLTGPNQNGQTVTTIHSLNEKPGDFCYSFNNWWWKGQVTLKWLVPNSSKSKLTYCSVPAKNPHSNWVIANSTGECLIVQ
jgi:hypothetical protein